MPADLSSLARVKRNFDIVEDVLSGASPEHLTGKYSLSERQIWNVLHDEDYKAILEQGRRDQILFLPRVNKRASKLIDSDDEKIALATCKAVWINTGITPSVAPNVSISMLYQDNRQVHLADSAATALQHLGMAIPLAEPVNGETPDED